MACNTEGQVLYDNVARYDGAIVAYDGISTVGKEFQNSYDWRDFSLFEAEQGTVSNLDIILTADKTINSAGIFIKPVIQQVFVDLRYESSPGNFTTIKSWNLLAGTGALDVIDFPDILITSGTRIRWRMLTPVGSVALIRQLCVGKRLDFPIGQRDGVAPVVLNGNMQVETSISVNGSVIGRSVRRMDRPSNLELSYLTESFVRNEWEQFTDHAVNNAFFYRPDKTNFPLESAFSTATSIPRPTNMMPPPLMVAKLPLRNLVNKDNI